jgi:polysaccharide deacetylase 2 family uncharacterized protein YibQ
LGQVRHTKYLFPFFILLSFAFITVAEQKTSFFSVTSTTRYLDPDTPRIAVIIDDVGQDLVLLRQLLDLSFPVTVSVIPGTEHAIKSAQWAHDRGFEVMVHLPMEPESFPVKDPGWNSLLFSMTRQELERATLRMLKEIPHAAGVNNHMGSRLTRKRSKMDPILNAVKKEGLYFIDSKTTPRSVGFNLAQTKWIPSSERNLFLDESLNQEAIREQFEILVETARKNGTAVGIAHLKPETIEALKMIDAADHRDVQFTSASNICWAPWRLRLEAQNSTNASGRNQFRVR